MGLLFGSARAHTYLKSGQVAPPRSERLQAQVCLGKIRPWPAYCLLNVIE